LDQRLEALFDTHDGEVSMHNDVDDHPDHRPPRSGPGSGSGVTGPAHIALVLGTPTLPSRPVDVGASGMRGVFP